MVKTVRGPIRSVYDAHDAGVTTWFWVRGVRVVIWGSGFRVQGFRFRVQGLGLRTWGQGFGFQVLSSQV